MRKVSKRKKVRTRSKCYVPAVHKALVAAARAIETADIVGPLAGEIAELVADIAIEYRKAGDCDCVCDLLQRIYPGWLIAPRL